MENLSLMRCAVSPYATFYSNGTCQIVLNYTNAYDDPTSGATAIVRGSECTNIAINSPTSISCYVQPYATFYTYGGSYTATLQFRKNMTSQYTYTVNQLMTPKSTGFKYGGCRTAIFSVLSDDPTLYDFTNSLDANTGACTKTFVGNNNNYDIYFTCTGVITSDISFNMGGVILPLAARPGELFCVKNMSFLRNFRAMCDTCHPICHFGKSS